MIALRTVSPCRLYGEFIPIAEVQIYLHIGWEILDLLEHDPAGREFVLMAPTQNEVAA